VERIVLAVKAGSDQPWLADTAADLARQTGSRVAVVSMDGVELEALAPLPREEYSQLARQSAEAAAERVRAAGVEATAAVRPGPVVPGVLLFAEEQEADVIVCGTAERGRVASRLLGNDALRLVERSRRPVLMVSPPVEN
jgi:nucleotide-binding universal stress UspA family protein